jgi:hypothetical protein
MEEIIIGILAILIGAAFCFAGIKYFLYLLPIWGFLVGFVFGSNLVYYILGNEHGFFATSLAIVVGIVAAIGFALFSYLYYYFAVILLGASLGYTLGIGVMDWLNIGGILAWIVGVAVGAVFAVGFIVLAMPAVLAIWGTAIAGAAAIMGGLALMLTQANLESLNGSFIGAAIADVNTPWLWILIGIGLAIAGAFAQIKMVGGMAAAIEKTQYKNPGMA